MKAKSMKLFKVSVITGILLAIFAVSTVFAITIIIDGTREGAWSGGGSVSDDGGNEGTIRDGNDIDRIEYTNDSFYYLLLDTFANTIWNNPFGTDPSFYICMNVDNNTGTGTSGLTQCANGTMTGIDYIIEVLGGPSLALNIYDENFNSLTDTNKQIAFANDITEIRITASVIGINSSNCITNMPTSFYFDNGIADPEDSTPDNGTTVIGCGAPTAITLENLSARTGTDTAALAGIAGLVLLAGAFLLFRRSRKHA